ncbi:hypothetical protein J6590_057779 [Homalodisca vitripennis]|nr:hypothetical protein J6590_057779 [Homalodisca vitripennis]
MSLSSSEAVHWAVCVDVELVPYVRASLTLMESNRNPLPAEYLLVVVPCSLYVDVIFTLHNSLLA